MKKIAWGNVEVRELAPGIFSLEDGDGVFMFFEMVSPVIPADEDARRLAEEMAHLIRCGV